jgi:hypothetical protein
MAHLSALEIENWLALYAASGLCCAFAVILSIFTTAVEVYTVKRPGGICGPSTV